MSKELFKTMLYLPSQAAAETEATIIKWYINPGDSFVKGQALAEVESAKSTFDFEAPCNGVVVNLLFQENCSVPFDSPLIEIETSDETMKSAIPSVSAKESAPAQMDIGAIEKPKSTPQIRTVSLLGIGTYLPQRIVPNSELLVEHLDINEDYIFGVTGIRERRWAKREKTL